MIDGPELPTLQQMQRRAAEAVRYLIATVMTDGAVAGEAHDHQGTPLARTIIMNARDSRASIDCALRSSPIDRFSGFSSDGEHTRADAGLRLTSSTSDRRRGDRAEQV